ncbi:NAD(P)/FAD-dependent oxidoreductase [Caenimonas soli]|uniref:NAD(P)/FAD-dependent oxidoreductase n=1 Tax=Caenimonas soli TaxID=2735555 RepID=UPI00155366EB|nr:FAD-dependent oxidoreductase [Caenimonas soli]NPC58330.1 FAD-dependent oxidoreductase [Caenimonas soli]
MRAHRGEGLPVPSSWQPQDASLGVTVIGAGIVGASAALHLQRAGFDVRLIDACGPGEGCSYGNAGGISPGSIVPAATPGLLAKVPKWLMDPDGPLSVQWSYFPHAVPWLVRWIREGRMDRLKRNSAALVALNGQPFEGYRELLTASQFDDLMRVSGHLFAWRSPKPMDGIARELRERAGIAMQFLNEAELREMEPAVSPLYRSGLLLPGNGFTVNPERLVKTIAQNLVAAGGTVLRRRVLGFDCGPDGPRMLYTDCGTLPVERVVIAAGAWSTKLAAELGVKVPLAPERGYHVMADAPGVRLRMPVLDAERRFMVTPMERGLCVAGTVEIADVDAPANYARSARLWEQAKRLLPGLPEMGSTQWMGMRPSMPDSLPIIDQHRTFRNVFFAFGHGHLGMTGAPRSGRLVAELVAGRTPSIDMQPFKVDRF